MPADDDFQRALADFATVAQEYCSLIDAFEAASPDKFYTRLESLLTRVHAAILPVVKNLPEKDDRELETIRMPPEEYAKICRQIGAASAPACRMLLDWYTELAKEGDYEDDMTRVKMFWDDLADIYRDLWTGLTLWRLDTAGAKAQASWEWRFNFEFHWGEHLFRAMATIHEIRYQCYFE